MTAVNGDAEKLSVPPHRDPIHHCSSLQLLIAPKSSTQAQAAETGSRDETAVRSSIRFRQRKYNHIRGYMEETDVSNDPITKKEEVNAEVRVHAVTLLRCFNELDRYSFSGITVEDDGLKALLFYALSHHPYFGHWEHMATASPFEPFIHNWSRLNAFVSDDISNPVVAGFYKELESVGSTDRLAFLQDRTTRNKAIQNLRELLQLIQDTPGLESYFTGARETPEVAESVAFEYLWTIFPPGEIVVSRPFMGRLQAFIVKESTDEVKRRRRGEAEFWNLQCWTYDWDGTEFNRMPVQFTFEQYKGFKSISSLPCYPMKFHKGTSNDDKDLGKIETPKALEEALIKRGKRFRELCLRKEGCQLFEYDGSALSSGTGVRKQPKNINQVIFPSTASRSNLIPI